MCLIKYVFNAILIEYIIFARMCVLHFIFLKSAVLIDSVQTKFKFNQVKFDKIKLYI